MRTNIRITEAELAAIRTFNDFDFTMLLSELNDHGWGEARKLIPMIVDAQQKRGERRI